jgi:DNA-binding transcriptional regulator/RsmH inhibitor MraZ
LLGNFTVSVEPGARISVPKPWRDRFPGVSWVVVPWPLDTREALAVFPPNAWEQRLASLELASADAVDPEVTIRILNIMTSEGIPLQLDKSGRLCLGQALADPIGLEKTAVVAGAGAYFRVFTPEGYERFRRENQQIPREVLTKLRMR